MAIQSKKIIQELKSLFAGIDVGAEELISPSARTAHLTRRRSLPIPTLTAPDW